MEPVQEAGWIGGRLLSGSSAMIWLIRLLRAEDKAGGSS
jgi:hypothetical protein